MTEIWSRLVSESKDKTMDYWKFFGARLVENSSISPDSDVLDVGCGTGSSFFPASMRTGKYGRIIGIDICDH